MVQNKKREDLRVIRTKNALFTTFFTMLSEMSFEDITVNDLCDRAGVRRATFYKHFCDKYDFLSYAIGRLRTEFDEKLWKYGKPGATKEYYTEYVKAMVDYLETHDGFVKKIFESDMLPFLVDALMRQNYIDTKERLEESVKHGVRMKASVDTVATMFTGGVANILIKWYEGGKQISKNQLVSEICALIDAMLS